MCLDSIKYGKFTHVRKHYPVLPFSFSILLCFCHRQFWRVADQSQSKRLDTWVSAVVSKDHLLVPLIFKGGWVIWIKPLQPFLFGKLCALLFSQSQENKTQTKPPNILCCHKRKGWSWAFVIRDEKGPSLVRKWQSGEFMPSGPEKRRCRCWWQITVLINLKAWSRAQS